MRNDSSTIQLLVAWRADVNLQARGNDLPLVFAVKRQRSELVKCLLDLGANPTVRSHSTARTPPSRGRWAGLAVQQFTTPGTEIARPIEESVNDWNASMIQS